MWHIEAELTVGPTIMEGDMRIVTIRRVAQTDALRDKIVDAFNKIGVQKITFWKGE